MKNNAFVFAGAVLLGSLSVSAVAEEIPAAGAAVVESTTPGQGTIAAAVNVSAKVEAINKETREITLKGPEGNVVTVTAGPEVRNFDQIKAGDMVSARYIEALTLTLKKDGKDVVAATTDEAMERAEAGETPAGAAARRIEVTADVIGVNEMTQTITLRGPNRTVDLKLRDPEQFKLVKVGDQVQATYTEAVAIALEPANQ